MIEQSSIRARIMNWICDRPVVGAILVTGPLFVSLFCGVDPFTNKPFRCGKAQQNQEESKPSKPKTAIEKGLNDD